MSQESTPPTFTVTRGSATPEEIAALTTVLAAVNASASSADSTARASGWSRPIRRMVRSTQLGGGWGSR
ncbi:acyl-CoA carboxylase subunit epsilon [Gephyromycinifex aptenodytis]|uniref:acyl-CoA carboxylase subunit epsilon n=1 Tax=Gephyromycinifex aptenodytis TaxID=2716227 RepID=UPI001446B5E0|nr:acyl-CoA carboxylase subunit epsilon [Gephyromycinifex aptenodytis]